MKKHLRILKCLSENKNLSKHFEPGHKRGQIYPLELLVAIISLYVYVSKLISLNYEKAIPNKGSKFEIFIIR